jgi:hypothetical protein
MYRSALGVWQDRVPRVFELLGFYLVDRRLRHWLPGISGLRRIKVLNSLLEVCLHALSPHSLSCSADVSPPLGSQSIATAPYSFIRNSSIPNDDNKASILASFSHGLWDLKTGFTRPAWKEVQRFSKHLRLDSTPSSNVQPLHGFEL